MNDGPRPEMLAFVPRDASRLLDVGCARGIFGTELRSVVPDAELWGVDPRPGDQGAYDRRITGFYPDDVPAATFDCIFFNDVLEHLEDPWEALRSSKRYLASGGVVVASIPNVRHISVLRPLITHGRWEYRDAGILDRTHLRFFTRSGIVDLFRSAGFSISSITPIRVAEHGRSAAFNRLLGGRLVDFLAERYAIVAVPQRDDSADG